MRNTYGTNTAVKASSNGWSSVSALKDFLICGCCVEDNADDFSSKRGEPYIYVCLVRNFVAKDRR